MIKKKLVLKDLFSPHPWQRERAGSWCDSVRRTGESPGRDGEKDIAGSRQDWQIADLRCQRVSGLLTSTSHWANMGPRDSTPSLRGNCVFSFWIPKWRLGFAPLTTIPVSRCSGTSARAPSWLLLSARQPQRLHVQLIRPTIVCGKGLGASVISSHHTDVSELAELCQFIRCTESPAPQTASTLSLSPNSVSSVCS